MSLSAKGPSVSENVCNMQLTFDLLHIWFPPVLCPLLLHSYISVSDTAVSDEHHVMLPLMSYLTRDFTQK